MKLFTREAGCYNTSVTFWGFLELNAMKSTDKHVLLNCFRREDGFSMRLSWHDSIYLNQFSVGHYYVRLYTHSHSTSSWLWQTVGIFSIVKSSSPCKLLNAMQTVWVNLPAPEPVEQDGKHRESCSSKPGKSGVRSSSRGRQTIVQTCCSRLRQLPRGWSQQCGDLAVKTHGQTAYQMAFLLWINLKVSITASTTQKPFFVDLICIVSSHNAKKVQEFSELVNFGWAKGKVREQLSEHTLRKAKSKK